jgi:hypothetical protein
MAFKIENILEKTNEMNKQIEKMRTQYKEDLQKSFSEIFTEFFNNTPEIKEIFWTQYTPYFNDGEECTFRVNDIYYNINVPEGYEDVYGDDDYEGSKFLSHKTSLSEIQGIITRIENVIKDPTSADKNDYYIGKYNYRSYNYDFDLSIAQKNLKEQIDRFDAVKKELELYPNINIAVHNFKTIKKFIETIDENAMQDIFGNHVKVIISKNGTTVEEYDHE